MNDPQIIVVGDRFPNGHHSRGGRVYSTQGIAPTIGSSHFSWEIYIVEGEKTDED